MKILVTGHKGFIGGHIYNYLKSNNYDVYGYDLGDELQDIKYDYIIHMAARGLIRLSTKYPHDYYKDGLDLTLKFLELSRKYNSKFIFPSSGSIKNPTNPYSLAKKNSVEILMSGPDRPCNNHGDILSIALLIHVQPYV